MNIVSPISNYSSYIEYFYANLLPPISPEERLLWVWYPDGPKCASCGAIITGRRSLKTFASGERTFCASCSSKFSPRTGTPLENTHASFKQFEMFLVMHDSGSKDKRIAEIIKVHPDTVAAWHAKNKFWKSHV